MQIAHQPSIYVLDTPGVLVPSIQDIETGLKLALAGRILVYKSYYFIFVRSVLFVSYPSSQIIQFIKIMILFRLQFSIGPSC